MTQEEKARAYDEALNKAKIEINTKGIGETVDLCKQLFPELAESEDERIRKIITDSVFYQYGAGVEYKDVLDYLDKLEKQKYNRMQPVYDNQESFESALDKAWKSYNESGARTVDSCEDDYTECAHAKGFREGFLFGLVKQKEQKPAEWSEEDEKQIAQIERICKNAGCSKMLQEKIHNWFDSLCFKIVKWDTDMMNIRNSIRDILYKEKRCPNAWFTYLEHCGPQTKYAYWKPSKEQIEALNALNCYGDLSYVGQQNQLISLYNDLKKLM